MTPAALALNPSPATLAKLGSILVHLQEARSDDGHHFDQIAMDQLLADPEVIEWIAAMDSIAMLPRKRKI